MCRESYQLITATGLLVSGVVLSFLSFFLTAGHIITDSVLWYFAQCLLYSGGIFGIRSYTITRLGKLNDKGTIDAK